MWSPIIQCDWVALSITFIARLLLVLSCRINACKCYTCPLPKRRTTNTVVNFGAKQMRVNEWPIRIRDSCWLLTYGPFSQHVSYGEGVRGGGLGVESPASLLIPFRCQWGLTQFLFLTIMSKNYFQTSPPAWMIMLLLSIHITSSSLPAIFQTVRIPFSSIIVRPMQYIWR